MKSIVLFFVAALFVSSALGTVPSMSLGAYLAALACLGVLAVGSSTTIQHAVVGISLLIYIGIISTYGERIDEGSMGEKWNSFNSIIAYLLMGYSVSYGFMKMSDNPSIYLCLFSLAIAIVIAVFVVMQYLQSSYFITNG
jgi:preprotein translocase subunit SecY